MSTATNTSSNSYQSRSCRRHFSMKKRHHHRQNLSTSYSSKGSSYTLTTPTTTPSTAVSYHLSTTPSISNTNNDHISSPQIPRDAVPIVNDYLSPTDNASIDPLPTDIHTTSITNDDNDTSQSSIKIEKDDKNTFQSYIEIENDSNKTSSSSINIEHKPSPSSLYHPPSSSTTMYQSTNTTPSTSPDPNPLDPHLRIFLTKIGWSDHDTNLLPPLRLTTLKAITSIPLRKLNYLLTICHTSVAYLFLDLRLLNLTMSNSVTFQLRATMPINIFEATL